MHRTDTHGMAPGGLFTDGNPATGTPATVVGNDWLNAIQEEIVTVVEAAGIPLVKGNWGQLLASLMLLAWPDGDFYLPLPANVMTDKTESGWDYEVSGVSRDPGVGDGIRELVGSLVVPPGLTVSGARCVYETYTGGGVTVALLGANGQITPSFPLPTSGVGGDPATTDDILAAPIEVSTPTRVGVWVVADPVGAFKIISAGLIVRRTAFQPAA